MLIPEWPFVSMPARSKIHAPRPDALRRGHRTLRRLALAVALLASSASQAADSLPVLTAATLQLAAALHRDTASTEPALYVGASPDGALLRELRLQIDGQAPLRYQFSEDEARALAAGGLKRLTPLPAGTHRLHGEFVARAATGKPGATRFAAQIDQTVTVAAPAYELIFASGGMLSSAKLDLQAARGDAALREADYLLASDRAFDAALVLETSAGDAQRRDAAYRALGLLPAQDAAVPAAVARYNNAVSAADAAALSSLGSADAGTSADALALRDLANVSAGYRALREGQNEAAMQSFRLVRSPGPYSNAAMLGLGWCYLWPSAARTSTTEVSLRPGNADAVAATRRQTPFRYLQAIAADARAEDLRRALIPWAELLGRDPLDPAVQEGMLAIPYALDHFGAHAQAQRYYERALATLEAAHGTLAAARREVGEGQVFAAIDARDADTSSGWPRLLVEQRDDAQAVPLRTLANDVAVAAPLREYRQLRTLDRTLAAQADLLQARGDSASLSQVAALRARLAAATQVSLAQTQTAMLATLQRLAQQTTKYQAEAEFAMARVYDRDPHGVAQ
jgi:hypothetical protein